MCTVGMCMCGHEDQRILGVVPQKIATFFFFETASLTDLKLVQFAGLTGHCASGICLSLLLELHVYATMPFVIVFKLWVQGVKLKTD